MRIVTFGLIACLTLAGCETIQGAGKDIQKAGEVLEGAVN
ncbi:Entericidin EcnA/B family protein [Roseovarius litorisediminis]|uniref:Entericidin EcnA/B family protein n=1 Tax=Roseovarius litorisediminis TaxID=1312363 RepID=A0A1Y5SGS0_9RHOB|nr:entericidin A/B family lipoprotein [Roseovarius litorisediminis]SLN39277.1 Entericidin EcnA/B family protein [Roseovarius litorisediminis]